MTFVRRFNDVCNQGTGLALLVNRTIDNRFSQPWTVSYGAPEVVSVTPNFGPTAGGYIATVNGRSLGGVGTTAQVCGVANDS